MHWQNAHTEEAWERQGGFPASDPLLDHVERETRELGVDGGKQRSHHFPPWDSVLTTMVPECRELSGSHVCLPAGDCRMEAPFHMQGAGKG